VQPRRQRRRGPGHRADRGAAIAALDERRHVDAGFGGERLARDVGLERRGIERTGVRDERRDAGVPEPVAQVRVFLALGVERPDEQDSRLPLSGR
jgi:hypothetical protein